MAVNLSSDIKKAISYLCDYMGLGNVRIRFRVKIPEDLIELIAAPVRIDELRPVEGFPDQRYNPIRTTYVILLVD